MSIEVRVPALGESVTEATVATWFKKPGDAVAQDEILCELETDKVSLDVPAPAAGILSEIIAQDGETVAANALLAMITAGGAAAAPAPKAEAAPAAAPAAPPATKDVEDAPSAKVAMAAAGLNRDQVQGSGRDGRVMKEDVAAAVASIKAAPAAAPAAAAAPRAQAAPDHRAPPERSAEHRCHADHL
jgi:2-oxoglutarate dehydrogenase E2 component (dihydrolipoamide succinyltransferase)